MMLLIFFFSVSVCDRIESSIIYRLIVNKVAFLFFRRLYCVKFQHRSLSEMSGIWLIFNQHTEGKIHDVKVDKKGQSKL